MCFWCNSIVYGSNHAFNLLLNVFQKKYKKMLPMQMILFVGFKTPTPVFLRSDNYCSKMPHNFLEIVMFIRNILQSYPLSLSSKQNKWQDMCVPQVDRTSGTQKIYHFYSCLEVKVIILTLELREIWYKSLCMYHDKI